MKRHPDNVKALFLAQEVDQITRVYLSGLPARDREAFWGAAPLGDRYDALLAKVAPIPRLYLHQLVTRYTNAYTLLSGLERDSARQEPSERGSRVLTVNQSVGSEVPAGCVRALMYRTQHSEPEVRQMIVEAASTWRRSTGVAAAVLCTKNGIDLEMTRDLV